MVAKFQVLQEAKMTGKSIFKRWPELVTILVIVSLVFVFFLPIFIHIHSIRRGGDWLQHYSFYASARRIILDYHQIPFRTPYFEGGYPMLAHPQDPSLDPIFLFPLIFGEVVGMKVIMLFYSLIGSLGMYYLTRWVLRFTRTGALLATLVFAFGNWLLSRMMDGNFDEGYFFTFPLILAFFLKSEKDKRYLIYSAFPLALTIFAAKYVFPIISLYLGLFALLKSFTLKGRSLRTNFVLPKNLVIVIVLAVMLASVKVMPMVKLLSSVSIKPDDIWAHDRQYDWQSLQASVAKNQIRLESSYVGVLALALCGVAFVLYFKELKRFIILLGIFTLLAMGSNAPINLYDIIRKLPIFDTMHAPAKYFNFFIMFSICLGAGKSLQLLEGWKGTIWARITGLGIILLGVGPLFIGNLRVQKSVFTDEMPPIRKEESFFQVELEGAFWPRPDNADQYFNVLRNVGTIDSYFLLNISRSSVPKYIVSKDNQQVPNPHYRGEVFFLDDVNQAELVYFSPNKILVKATVYRPGLLLINQNYDKNWHTNVGHLEPYKLKEGLRENKLNKGLLAVRIANKGDFLVQLSYSVPAFYIGLAISCATFVVLVVLLIRNRKPAARPGECTNI